MAERTALVIIDGQIQQLPVGDTLAGAGGDTELAKVNIGNGIDQIQDDTNGIFWIAPWDGSFIEWRIWTGSGSSGTIEIDVLKNGTTIGEDIDLTAQSSNSATGLAISFSAGDVFKFNVDSNTNATKVVVQLLAEKT